VQLLTVAVLAIAITLTGVLQRATKRQAAEALAASPAI
jgi:hypothetical protein